MGKALLTCLVVSLVYSVVAVIVLGAATGLIKYVFYKIVAEQINEQVTLEEGHATYELLRKPSIPIHKSFYFFNLTNPGEFEEGTAKAVLKEVGPYIYVQKKMKYFIESEDSSELIYTESQYYFYDSYHSDSSLKETDIICTVNIPLMAGVYAVMDEYSRFHDIYKSIINTTSSHLYTCQPVSSLIWGYTDSLLEELYNLGFIPTKVAWLQTNGSSANSSRVSKVYTGVKDIAKIAQYFQWNGYKYHLNTWPGGSDANLIRGTEGAFFKPNLKPGESLTLFIGDLQRSFDLQNTDTVYHLGVRTLRYQFPISSYKSAFTEPDNAKYSSWCPDGLFYLGPIRTPVLPIYGSKPHFLDGDSSLLDGVDGLEPSSTMHESHIDVEPNVGANVDFGVKLQLNIRINRSSDYTFLENLQGVDAHGSLFLPVVYIDEHSEFSEEIKDYLDDNGLNDLIVLEDLVNKLFYILAGLTGVSMLITVLLVIGIVITVIKLRRKKAEEVKPLLVTNAQTPIRHRINYHHQA